MKHVHKHKLLLALFVAVGFGLLNATGASAFTPRGELESSDIKRINYLSNTRVELVYDDGRGPTNAVFVAETGPLGSLLAETECRSDVAELSVNSATSVTIDYSYIVTSGSTTDCERGQVQVTSTSVFDNYSNYQYHAYYVDAEQKYIMMPHYRHAAGCFPGFITTNHSNGLFSPWPSDAVGANADFYVELEDNLDYKYPPGDNRLNDDEYTHTFIDTKDSNFVSRKACTGPDFVLNNNINIGPHTAIPDYFLDIVADRYGLAVGEDGTTDTDPTVGDTTSTEPTCTTEAGALGWILCPFVEFMEGSAVELLNNSVAGLLFVDLGSDGINDIWTNVLGVANVMFVVIFLLIIFAQALGFSDAYTIKRMLPRLIIGVIMTQASLFIMELLVDLFNVLGVSLSSLMLSAVGNDISFSLSLTDGGAGGAGEDVTSALLGGGSALLLYSNIPAILAFASVAWSAILLTVLAIIFILTARQIALVLMTVFAPIAFISWVLPNTEKLFKEWMDNFIKLLLMFPLIMIFLSTGPIVARVLGATTGSEGNVFDTATILIAYVVPYAMIPFTFRFAGNLFGNLAGVISNAQQKIRGGYSGGGKSGAGAGGKQSKYQERKARFEAGGLLKSNTGLSGVVNRSVARAGAFKPLQASSYNLKDGKAQAKIRAQVAANMKQAGANDAESDAMFNANAQDENYLALLASDPSNREETYNKMLGEAKNDQQKAAIKQAYAAANSTTDNVGVRQRALTQLATTGRHFKAGEDGYHEMAKMAASIAGGSYDEDTQSFVGNESGRALYASTMNEAQAMAGKAGRWDLAGTNNGAGYDIEAGWNKASLYELGNGKPQVFTAMHQEAIRKLSTGDPDDEAGAARIWHEFEQIQQGAKGEVAAKIQDTIGPAGRRKIVAGSSGPIGSVDTILRKYSPSEVGARKYERPDPSQLGNNQQGGGPAAPGAGPVAGPGTP